jgi:hypothetical protein
MATRAKGLLMRLLMLQAVHPSTTVGSNESTEGVLPSRIALTGSGQPSIMHRTCGQFGLRDPVRVDVPTLESE